MSLGSRNTRVGNALRRLALRLVLGKSGYRYLVRTLSADMRVKTARWVNFVVRKDGVERTVEADWIKTLARVCWPDIEVERTRRDAERATWDSNAS